MDHLFNTAQKYGSLSKGLHWGVSLTILVMLILGIVMEELDKTSTIRPTLYLVHKSIGIIVFPIALAWFVLWLGQKKPEPLTEIPKPLHRLSKIIHTLLIISAVLMPLSGWVMSSAFSGKGVSLFNLITIPPIASYDPAFGRAALGLHILVSWILIGAGGLHITAALYHHFIRKNIVLMRMFPFSKPIKAVKKKKKSSNVHHLGRK